MTIIKNELFDESNLIAAIKKIIPEAEIQSSLTTQVVINLPNEHSNIFPDVFRMLEINKTGFCIKGMGISCTTMEKVFLRYINLFHFHCFTHKINRKSFVETVGLTFFFYTNN